jgi:hypothetical protein
MRPERARERRGLRANAGPFVFQAHRIGQELPAKGRDDMADLLVHGCGTVHLLRPITSAGAAWVDENIPEDATWFGGAVAVEHRYIRDIIIGAVADGLGVA